MTEKKNISCENTMSTSKHEISSNKSILNKPESAGIKTCNESAVRSVDVSKKKSAITSRQLAEKKTVRTSMTTNVNSSMERFV